MVEITPDKIHTRCEKNKMTKPQKCSIAPYPTHIVLYQSVFALTSREVECKELLLPQERDDAWGERPQHIHVGHHVDNGVVAEQGQDHGKAPRFWRQRNVNVGIKMYLMRERTRSWSRNRRQNWYLILKKQLYSILCVDFLGRDSSN